MAATIAILAGTAVASATAQSLEEKVSVCAGCHGEKGVPVDGSIPVLAGQNEGYLYLQMRDYKLGNRSNPVMGSIAQALEKPDMLALAHWFATQPWPDLRQPTAPPDVAERASRVADSAVCQSCHIDGWRGTGATPRLAGQGESYLRQTMAAFRSGERANNPWMAALLKTYSDGDIDALARYLAGL
jgi:cytochrome c553